MLVDSDVLIAHLRGLDSARGWLRATRMRLGRPLTASVVSVTEVTGGMGSAERREVSRLVASMRLVPVSPAVALRAGEFMLRYRRSHTAIGLGDYLVAATADFHGLELATLNVKHFPMFKGLRSAFALV